MYQNIYVSHSWVEIEPGGNANKYNDDDMEVMIIDDDDDDMEVMIIDDDDYFEYGYDEDDSDN